MTAIRPVDYEDLDGELRRAVQPRYERLGYLGDFFRYTAHQPAALIAFDAFTEACKRAVGPSLAETIALTVATRLGNDYERNQHERRAVRSGLGRGWVAGVERLDPDDTSNPLGEAERAVQRFVLAAVDPDGAASGARLDDVVAIVGESTAVAVALLTARFAAHALVSRALGLRAAVPSIFEDGFDG